jgi:hypothetical protein
MPRTAHLMARSLGMPYNRARLTADPDYNIQLGRHYLRTLLRRYDGEVVLAMAAYNAGPRRVDGWIELNGDPRRGTPHDLVDWVELIPFDETRNYVQRVLEGRGLYRLRLADGAARIPFLQVVGPIRPMPQPNLKPLGAARELERAVMATRAPRPRLKPVATELASTPSAAMIIPDAGPPERGAQLADLAADVGPEAIARPGQTPGAPSRIPQARPASASLDAAGDLAGLEVWPELKPDGRLGIEAATAPPPQPELKPAGP